MNDHVDFSVVVPVHNRAGLIGRCIDSIMSQSYQPNEIIVVDDGSTDGTASAVPPAASLRVLQQQNGGAAAARTTGVRAARSRWVAFLDSDDLWLPDHLMRLSSAIEQTSGAAVHYFDDTRRGPDEGSVLQWDRASLRTPGTVRVQRKWGAMGPTPNTAGHVAVKRRIARRGPEHRLLPASLAHARRH